MDEHNGKAVIIGSKKEFFEKWKAGILGNATRLWWDPNEAWASDAREFGFREHRAGGGTWERVWRAQFWNTVYFWQGAGRIFTMDDVCPDEYQTIQGEICRTFRGIEGYIGASQFPMRKAMAAGILTHRTYLQTRLLLEQYMDPSSRDDLDMLLELYPDATIEFTCFSVNVGNIPNRNTLFWEVRNY